MQETLGAIRILRYKQYIPAQPSFLKRVVHIIDFTLGVRGNLKKIAQCDIVISVIPFTSSALLGNMLSRKHKAKHWIHIQDFEFDAAFQSGLTNSRKQGKGPLYRQLMRLERGILNKAHRISTISHNMMTQLASKTTTATYYLPNWVSAKEASFKEKHPLLQSKKFKLLYSGNIGDKQDWTFFLEVIKKLDTKVFEIVIVGDGSKKQWLEDQMAGAFETTIYPPVPYEELTSLLHSADAHILFQKTSVLDTVMPSKVLGMMASGKPSIVTGHPEAEVGAVLKDSGGGYYISQNNSDQVTAALHRLLEDKEKSLQMGKKARTYVLEKYAKAPILDAFSSELSQL